MFRLLNPYHTEHTLCTEKVHSSFLDTKNVWYYDKDGFELTKLEQEFYKVSGFGIFLNDCLNHCCWQEPWFELSDNNFILDHSLVLHRCSFTGDARQQLLESVKKVPRLSYLLKSLSKWGLDFNLDYIDNEGKLTEVIHIEVDMKNYHDFLQRKEELENFVLSTDWKHVYKFLDLNRNKWECLVGFEQNDWKARQLGFKKAEITHKAI